jgi:plasmid stability protein
MAKTVQVRNAPRAVHKKLKARVAAAGMSLSSYRQQEIRKSAEVPTMEEMRRRLARLKPIAESKPFAV